MMPRYVKKEVNMDKIYRYDNATIYVLRLDKYDRENLKKATEVFLRKVVSGGNKNGNSNSSKNFREKQVLYRQT